MTVRGFLAWYLTTVALVGVSGAAMWHGIQAHRHPDTAALVAPPAETSPPSAQVADVQPTQLAASDQAEATPSKLRTPQSGAAHQPLPPLRVPTQPGSAALAAGGATQPWIAGLKPRFPAKVAARAPTHRYPRTVVAQRADIYPYYGPGSYAFAYPPGVAPWQIRRYAYYYPPYGFYTPYRFYYYPAD